MAAITYTAQATDPRADKFTCPRCHRVYPFPKEHERPDPLRVRLVVHERRRRPIVEEFHPRIGGADRG